MLRVLRHHWFVICLCVFVPLGFAIGHMTPKSRLDEFELSTGQWLSRGSVALILFCMSVTLDSRRIAAAIRSPRAVIWATLINAAVIPLLAWPLTWLQPIADFQVGLMIAASVPCTMAAASMWTRTAGGNDAISLVVTTITNGFCFLVAPFWLGLTTGTDLKLDPGEMIVPLVLGSLVPILVGQGVRLFEAVARLADRRKGLINNIAQASILLQMVWTCMLAGPSIGRGVSSGDGRGYFGAAIAWGSCVVLHVVALLLGSRGGRLLGLPREDQIAAGFAASQKTLPIGLLIARDRRLLGSLNMPFASFPMLMYHVSQMIIDTIIAERLRPAAAEELSESA